MLAKVKEANKSFEPDKFDLGIHPGVTQTLTIFKPSVLLSQYGFINPTKMALSFFWTQAAQPLETKVTA